MSKKALITGIAGQDGAYLSSHLQSLGYNVVGIARRNKDLSNLRRLKTNPRIIYADVTEAKNICEIIDSERPDEIYNLAAQSHVGYSFRNPSLTMDVNYGGLVNIIEGVKKTCSKTKIYQASTSEMFGGSDKVLNEDSAFNPKSPYGISKVAAYWAAENAKAVGLFVANGILFNHESPIRGGDFVTRKITKAVSSLQDEWVPLELGNLDAGRDWGFAGDYVKAMHKMMQHNEPDTFVVATKTVHTVRDLLYIALVSTGMEIESKGVGLDEKWYADGKLAAKINPKFYRDNEVHNLIGDFSKAKELLGWTPEVNFEKLVKMMIEAEK